MQQQAESPLCEQLTHAQTALAAESQVAIVLAGRCHWHCSQGQAASSPKGGMQNVVVQDSSHAPVDDAAIGGRRLAVKEADRVVQHQIQALDAVQTTSLSELLNLLA